MKIWYWQSIFNRQIPAQKLCKLFESQYPRPPLIVYHISDDKSTHFLVMRFVCQLQGRMTLILFTDVWFLGGIAWNVIVLREFLIFRFQEEVKLMTKRINWIDSWPKSFLIHAFVLAFSKKFEKCCSIGDDLFFSERFLLILAFKVD